MSQKTLDEKIFEEFMDNVSKKAILSDSSVKDLKKFIAKQNISEEDWALLVDKDCFPPKKEGNEK
jgi:hypothetical protein